MSSITIFHDITDVDVTPPAIGLTEHCSLNFRDATGTKMVVVLSEKPFQALKSAVNGFEPKPGFAA